MEPSTVVVVFLSFLLLYIFCGLSINQHLTARLIKIHFLLNEHRWKIFFYTLQPRHSSWRLSNRTRVNSLELINLRCDLELIRKPTEGHNNLRLNFFSFHFESGYFAGRRERILLSVEIPIKIDDVKDANMCVMRIW